MFFPGHDMFFKDLPLLPYPQYKMLHPIILGLSYDSIPTIEASRKRTKHLRNLMTYKMHSILILVQVPGGSQDDPRSQARHVVAPAAPGQQLC